MPGFVLHLGATVLCAHGGQAMPAAPTPRVMVGVQPAATIGTPYTVAGCPFVPSGGNGPCVTAQWTVGATRVTSGGQPLVISTGSGSEMRQAVGVAVFFGMLGVTLFGLIFTPIFYVVVRNLAEGRKRKEEPAVVT